MNESPLQPITPNEAEARRRRVLQLARSIGFVGRIEYRHFRSQTGGAQYGRGTDEGGDLLTVFAEAFERDADPNDFSLLSMIAHERGHQLVARHPKLNRILAQSTPRAEEVLASLLGALVLRGTHDSDTLVAKATVDLLGDNDDVESASRLIHSLLQLLEETL